ncbi:MAG: hypothetical protein WKF76_02535 [Nocardioidaceae bacterium]
MAVGVAAHLSPRATAASWWPRQMPRNGTSSCHGSRDQVLRVGEPGVVGVVVGAHLAAEHQQAVVAVELVGKRLAVRRPGVVGKPGVE